MNELKPCPFCGGEAKFHLCAELDNEGMAAVFKDYVGIHCVKCRIATPPIIGKSAAAKLWNNRAKNKKEDNNAEYN